MKEPAAAFKALPAIYEKKIERFDREILKKHPGRIGELASTGELMIDGQRVPNSNYADLMRELYIHNKAHNLTGMDSLTSTLSSLMSSSSSSSSSSSTSTSSHSIDNLISNSKIINQIITPEQHEEMTEGEEGSHSKKSSSFHPYSRRTKQLRHSLKYQDAQANPIPPPPTSSSFAAPTLPPGQVPKTLRLYD